MGFRKDIGHRVLNAAAAGSSYKDAGVDIDAVRRIFHADYASSESCAVRFCWIRVEAASVSPDD